MSIKSEEYHHHVKCRRQATNTNNGVMKNSPVLSHQGDIGTLASSVFAEKMASSIKAQQQSFYVTLAEESPQELFLESDESTYDSYHCRETDVCRDSSDLDDSDSESSTYHRIMEVIEYDVASMSGNEILYSEDSSSGSDDYFLTSIATNKTTRQSIKNVGNSDFADTEYSLSESTHDPELGLADYWKCVKCKNKQNNPMFRYCEKCYQIRKSHFPPRPRKSNLKRKKFSSPSVSGGDTMVVVTKNTTTSKSDCESNLECENEQHQLENNNDTKNIKDNILLSNYRLQDKYKRHNNECKKRKLNYSANDNNRNEQEINNSNSLTETTDSNDLDSTESSDNEKNDHFNGSKTKIENKKRKNSNNDVKNNLIKAKKLNFSEDENNSTKCSNNTTKFTNFVSYITQKDSGISSTIPSSQEMPSSSSQSEIISDNKYIIDDGSDTTIVEELEDKEIKEIEQKYINLSPSSNENLPISSPLNDATIQKSNAELSEIGQCMVCLSEPKNGAFIHTKFVHLCCCYRCAVKIWNSRKKCPICNCSVKNVLKLFVH